MPSNSGLFIVSVLINENNNYYSFVSIIRHLIPIPVWSFNIFFHLTTNRRISHSTTFYVVYYDTLYERDDDGDLWEAHAIDTTQNWKSENILNAPVTLTSNEPNLSLFTHARTPTKI